MSSTILGGIIADLRNEGVVVFRVIDLDSQIELETSIGVLTYDK